MFFAKDKVNKFGGLIMNLFTKVMTMMLAEGDADLGQFNWVYSVRDAVNTILWPILIVVIAAGSIYAIVLGVNMARADSTEKREEAKKRVVNVIVAMAIVVGLILLLQLFLNVILPNLLPDVAPEA